MADELMNDTTKYGVLHRLRLHEASLRKHQQVSDTGALDLADALLRAREEIFRLRNQLVDEAKAALNAVPMEGRSDE